jgi:hypothetical protein
MQEGAGDSPPSICALAADHDHVRRYAEPAEATPQADGLLELVIHIRLNDQEVEIAVRSGDAAGVRAE